MWSRSNNDARAPARALESLAGLIRSGRSVWAALTDWHEYVTGRLAGDLLRLKDLIDLGMTPPEAIRVVGVGTGPMAEAARLLHPALLMHERTGTDIARSIDHLAVWLHERCNDVEAGRAASAGAKISGRVVAALPLFFLPLGSLGRARLLDDVGVVIMVAGVGLALVGMRWIGKLVPTPAGPGDAADAFVRSATLLLRGGMPMRPAFDAAAASTGGCMNEPSGRVALGASWSQALERSPEPFLRRVGAIARRGEQLGVPIASALEELADQRRMAVAREFEGRLRRAPVLMMVPLTLCVLPSFGLLALGPFLRGLVNG